MSDAPPGEITVLLKAWKTGNESALDRLTLLIGGELRHYTSNGTAVTTLSVATKESWKNDKGEWQSRTGWHSVVAFGRFAEYARSLPKGTHVMVQGS